MEKYQKMYTILNKKVRKLSADSDEVTSATCAEENRTESYVGSLIANGTDVIKKLEELELELDEPNVEVLLAKTQRIVKSLHKVKFNAGCVKAEIVEKQKTNQKEIRELVIPPVSGAMTYKKWFRSVNTKNRSLTSSAAKKNFVAALKPTILIPNIQASVERLETVGELVNLVKLEAGGFPNLVEDCLKLITSLKIPQLATSRKLLIDAQIKAVSVGLEIFDCFKDHLEEIPDRLIKALKNDILAHRWRAELEEKISNLTVHHEESSFVFLKEALQPGSLETSFLTVRQAVGDAECDEPDDLDGEVDVSKLNSDRKRVLMTIFFAFTEARDKLQKIRGEAGTSEITAYQKFYCPSQKRQEKVFNTQEHHEAHHLHEVEDEEELEEEFDGGENRIFFTRASLDQDKQDALTLAKLMLAEWRKTSPNNAPERSPMKPCELGCEMMEHPYGALRFCPVVLSKTPNEVNDLIRKLPRKKCGKCLSNSSDKHNTSNCILGRYGCGTCFRKGESSETQATHLSWNCRRHPGVAERLATARAMSAEPKQIDFRQHRVLHTQEQSVEEEEENYDEAEDYAHDTDAKLLLFTNHLLRDDWFEDAEDYPLPHSNTATWEDKDECQADDSELEFDEDCLPVQSEAALWDDREELQANPPEPEVPSPPTDQFEAPAAQANLLCTLQQEPTTPPAQEKLAQITQRCTKRLFNSNMHCNSTHLMSNVTENDISKSVTSKGAQFISNNQGKGKIEWLSIIFNCKKGLRKLNKRLFFFIVVLSCLERICPESVETLSLNQSDINQSYPNKAFSEAVSKERIISQNKKWDKSESSIFLRWDYHKNNPFLPPISDKIAQTQGKVTGDRHTCSKDTQTIYSLIKMGSFSDSKYVKSSHFTPASIFAPLNFKKTLPRETHGALMLSQNSDGKVEVSKKHQGGSSKQWAKGLNPIANSKVAKCLLTEMTGLRLSQKGDPKVNLKVSKQGINKIIMVTGQTRQEKEEPSPNIGCHVFRQLSKRNKRVTSKKWGRYRSKRNMLYKG